MKLEATGGGGFADGAVDLGDPPTHGRPEFGLVERGLSFVDGDLGAVDLGLCLGDRPGGGSLTVDRHRRLGRGEAGLGGLDLLLRRGHLLSRPGGGRSARALFRQRQRSLRGCDERVSSLSGVARRASARARRPRSAGCWSAPDCLRRARLLRALATDACD